MTYCARCQGILTDKQTILLGDKEGESMHFYCRWKQDQELKEKRDKEFEEEIQARRKFLKGR
jgi:uncharacterized protein YbcI